MYNQILNRFNEINEILKSNRIIDVKITDEIKYISKTLMLNKTEFDKLSSEEKELIKRRANF